MTLFYILYATGIPVSYLSVRYFITHVEKHPYTVGEKIFAVACALFSFIPVVAWIVVAGAAALHNRIEKFHFSFLDKKAKW